MITSIEREIFSDLDIRGLPVQRVVPANGGLRVQRAPARVSHSGGVSRGRRELGAGRVGVAKLSASLRQILL